MTWKKRTDEDFETSSYLLHVKITAAKCDVFVEGGEKSVQCVSECDGPSVLALARLVALWEITKKIRNKEKFEKGLKWIFFRIFIDFQISFL